MKVQVIASALLLGCCAAANGDAATPCFSSTVIELSGRTEGEPGRLDDGTMQSNDILGGFGNSVAHLPDIDGDGVDDLAVGVSGYHSGADYAGAVLVLRLLQDGSVKAQTEISAGIGLAAGSEGVLDGLGENDHLGSSVAPLGDFDGDGVTELAAGAYKSDMTRGAVWILRLNALGQARTARKIGRDDLPLSLPDHFGWGMTTFAVDLDDDAETVELAVGAFCDNSCFGSVTILYINKVDSSLRSHLVIDGQGTAGFSFVDPAADQFFGHSLALLGDTAGRGDIEVVVGTPGLGDGDGGLEAGGIYILSITADNGGDATVDVTGSLLLSSTHGDVASSGLAPPVAMDFWGAAVATLPDLDNEYVACIISLPFPARLRCWRGLDAHTVLYCTLRSGMPEVAVGAWVFGGFGYVDLLFFDAPVATSSDGEDILDVPMPALRSGVRLGKSDLSPLPPSIQATIREDAAWGAGSVASLGDLGGSEGTVIAIAAPYDKGGMSRRGGAVFIVKLLGLADGSVEDGCSVYATDDDAVESDAVAGPTHVSRLDFSLVVLGVGAMLAPAECWRQQMLA